jgi:DNA processing protein
LAYGIDHTAHKAALKYGLDTVGVMANGMDIIYPAAHKGLAREMISQGGLLTEFMSGTQPDKQNFPRRNRIVAGLCDAVLVVETDIKGGSMITAELALGYNREVFAMPGRINDSRSTGCNYLVRENRARLSMDPDDLLHFMGWEPPERRPAQPELLTVLGPDESLILQALREGRQYLEDIRKATLLPWPRFHSALLNLEINGAVQKIPGNMLRMAIGG